MEPWTEMGETGVCYSSRDENKTFITNFHFNTFTLHFMHLYRTISQDREFSRFR